MRSGDIVLLRGCEIGRLLTGKQLPVIDAVRAAYEEHGAGESSLPHSTFLRFPNDKESRIIALPAYLGGDFEVAGVKWVASFPANLNSNLDRASAVLILNSPQTGIPEAVMEGSIISAQRTAASAALAAKFLHQGLDHTRVGMIGCGLINREIIRFLHAVFPDVERVILFDKSNLRAAQFAEKCRSLFPEVRFSIAQEIEDVFREASLISFATTAGKPHVFDLNDCAPGTTILHVSLRDLSPDVILSSDNVVDDLDHVCRAQTSIHLTEQKIGNRDFVRCSLPEILRGDAAHREGKHAVTVFSPFGLGILDIAVGNLVRDLALVEGIGTVIDSFLPEPWVETASYV